MRSLCAACTIATKLAASTLISAAIDQYRCDPTSPPRRMLMPLPKAMSTTSVDTTVSAIVTLAIADAAPRSRARDAHLLVLELAIALEQVFHQRLAAALGQPVR